MQLCLSLSVSLLFYQIVFRILLFVRRNAVKLRQANRATRIFIYQSSQKKSFVYSFHMLAVLPRCCTRATFQSIKTMPKSNKTSYCLENIRFAQHKELPDASETAFTSRQYQNCVSSTNFAYLVSHPPFEWLLCTWMKYKNKKQKKICPNSFLTVKFIISTNYTTPICKMCANLQRSTTKTQNKHNKKIGMK